MRVFSGVKPTGGLHLGNYLGAIRHWVKMQETHECIYCVVDLHAITVAQNPDELRKNSLEVAAAYIACGIDPEKSIIFNQSSVAAHSELAWILSCNTTIGKLNRMTQFKDKAGKNKEKASLGLYSYPVLMAADILAYHATHVPVGDDQKQHLELTRDIASVFNEYYNEDFFPLPEPLILGEATRVMSLRDGNKKMSKSDDSDLSCVYLTDSDDDIAKKIRKAKSDTVPGISYDIENRPETSNLLTIYAAIRNSDLEKTTAECADMDFKTFKNVIADALIEHLKPIRARYQELMENPDHLKSILKEGSVKAANISTPIIEKTKETTGFISL